MPSTPTCAIVVTYHPSADDLDNLHALAKEFASIVVVDNGSAPLPLAALQQAIAETGSVLIENGENLGIATALNRGMHWAMQNRFELAVLFDQDSLIVPGFAAAMLQHYTAAAQREQIGLLSPVHLDRAHRTVIAPHPGPGGNPVTITSGSLLPLAVYRQLGSFVDALFIDEVDTEYCLRIYRIGYRVEVAPDAHLLHLIGDSTPVVFLGKRLCTLTHHSAIRRYYSVRNRIWMIRHYGMVFPRFSLRLARGICSDLFKVALGETEKRRKLAGMLHGAYDGLRGRGGPYSS